MVFFYIYIEFMLLEMYTIARWSHFVYTFIAKNLFASQKKSPGKKNSEACTENRAREGIYIIIIKFCQLFCQYFESFCCVVFLFVSQFDQKQNKSLLEEFNSVHVSSPKGKASKRSKVCCQC